MDPRQEHDVLVSRRALLKGASWGLGTAALADLLAAEGLASPAASARAVGGGALGAPHFAPRAKRVIWLFMSGAPSQIDMWDHKPKLREMFDEDIPDSIVNGQRFTTMTSGQARFPIAPSIFDFARHGESGTEVSELLPYTAQVVDDLCLVRTVHTTSINHDPGITFIQTGAEQPGRPSMGAWLSYGLGSSNRDLPTFVVLHSSWSAKRDAQALYSRLWGAGWLPSEHQGVSLRSVGDPVLYLSDPPGVAPEERRRMLDGLAALNAQHHEAIGDPEIRTRIAQYEMAHRMQSSVPELVDLKSEPEHVLDLYGPDVHKPGTFAYNCLLARRMAERDVRFVQIFIRGWDQHGNLPGDIRLQCRDVDQASAALVTDLKQRGMLEDTLVVWGGEFGRTTYCQGALSPDNYGRDHHPRCYSMWLAGGGIRPGTVYGTTDDFSYNIVENPVHIHDLNATILHCLGIDHERLTYRFQGRNFRLTDVHGEIVQGLLA
ncbi:MAG: DUF1501 domain-containing protein [Planctomycetota bacterium]